MVRGNGEECVEIYSDGACLGNPGPGGWGVVLRWRAVERELSGGEAETTNNRMELMAAIEGLAAENLVVAECQPRVVDALGID